MERTIDEAVANLKEYTRKDRIVRENHVESDFEKFCEGHCRDIETLIEAVESLERIVNGKEV